METKGERREVPPLWRGMADAITRLDGVRAEVVASARPDDHGLVPKLGERMLTKLAQLARFGLTIDRPLFRASGWR